MPHRVPEPDDDLGVSDLVELVMIEHFPGGQMHSPTTAALAAGRAKVIIRDNANDDTPLIEGWDD